ncbi:MAG: endonuclease domain-containing protein [Deltaproteobacteria bacterium]|nr:endonuclease domain-containing protein [Deltaproteobacteria bacterium]
MTFEETDFFCKNLELRKESTDTEKVLWHCLRSKQLSGLKFRRQQPMGNFIVDFVCLEKRVIIECDGGQHAFQVEKDKERDQWFEKEGYRVLRFWDSDVLNNTEGVLEAISEACQGHPPLDPLPSREGRAI